MGGSREGGRTRESTGGMEEEGRGDGVAGGSGLHEYSADRFSIFPPGCPPATDMRCSRDDTLPDSPPPHSVLSASFQPCVKCPTL